MHPIEWRANIQGWKFNALAVLGVKSLNVIGMELSCDCERLGRVNLILGARPIPTVVERSVGVPGARAIAERIHAATAVIADAVFVGSVFALSVVRVRSTLINASVGGYLLCSCVTLKEIHLRTISASHCLSVTVLGSCLSTTLVFVHSDEVHGCIEAARH